MPRRVHETAVSLSRMHQAPRTRGPRRFSFTSLSKPKAHMATPDVLIFDTTLRDGEQAPGNSLSPEEKLRLARQLDALGVDIIEAGFPAASEGDYRSVREIAAEVRRPVIAALARCHERDIELAGEALAPGGARPAPRVHLDLRPAHPGEAADHPGRGARAGPRRGPPARELHRRRGVLRRGCEPDRSRLSLPGGGARHRRGRHDDQSARTRWATRCPDEYAAMFRDVRERVPGSERVVLSAHCHDDLGLAVANTLAAIEAGVGAGRVHRQRDRRAGGERGAGGDRDGQPGPERRRRIPAATSSRARSTAPASSSPTSPGVFPQPNKAIVGPQRLRPRGRDPPARDAAERAHLRDHPARDGRHSALDPGARQALRPARAGAPLPRAGLRADRGRSWPRSTRQFTALADRKREILDEDLLALLHESFHDAPEEYQLTHLRVVCGSVTRRRPRSG